MKFIHCADLHLDSKMESNLTREKAKERRDELMQTFIQMINYGRDKKVKAIIIAGDMFDTSKNTQVRIKRRVLEQIKKASDIDFIYLRGNHDRVDFFENLDDKPSNLFTFTKDWSFVEYDNISIYACELSKDTKDSLYSSLSLKEDRVNIVALHGQESKYLVPDNGEIINLTLLQNKNIDYLALGHIHQYKYEKLDNRGYYCYSGCLEGRGFDEIGKKGFVLLEVIDNKIVHEFIPFAKREFHEVKIELSGYVSEVDVSNKINDYIKDIPSKDLVKLILHGEIDEESDFETEYILNQLKDKYFYIKMYNETEFNIKYEKYTNDISLKGEFIRLIHESDLEEKEKKAIILTGLKAIEGREIEL